MHPLQAARLMLNRKGQRRNLPQAARLLLITHAPLVRGSSRQQKRWLGSVDRVGHAVWLMLLAAVEAAEGGVVDGRAVAITPGAPRLRVGRGLDVGWARVGTQFGAQLARRTSRAQVCGDGPILVRAREERRVVRAVWPQR